MDITIFHNPACGTSRKVLGMIRDSGAEPVVVQYLKTPPDVAMLTDLLSRMGIGARDLLRAKEAPYAELGLDDPAKTEAELIAAMVAHPILINRPIVVTPEAVRLCRPAELVQPMLTPA
jgi:arsenate reductase (glutaredoxin)